MSQYQTKHSDYLFKFNTLSHCSQCKREHRAMLTEKEQKQLGLKVVERSRDDSLN